MSFKKGQPRPKGAGRKPGQVNRMTKTAREAFQLAFEGIGGAGRLQEWAETEPAEFFKLYARLIPVEHVGEGGEGPISTVVKHVFETVQK